MKLLITGAAGFIGSHAVERFLTKGFEVTGIDNFNNYYDTNLKLNTAKLLESKGATMLNLDLRFQDTYSLLEKYFDFIIHFAAQPGISPTSSFEDYYSNNIIATEKLIAFANTNKALKHLINIATSSIYGIEAKLDESSAPQPVSWYGVTKLTAEQLILANSRSNRFNASSLRLYSVYGPRERPDKLYTRLIDCGLNNLPFTLFEGSEMHFRSFTYVEDIIDGIETAIERHASINNEIINLGSTIELSTLEGIRLVEELLNIEINILTVEKRAGDQLHTKASINKAERLLNYAPKTTLEQGLEKHIEWFKANFKYV